MTPFGEKLRQLRAQHAVNQKQMAKALGVSAAYLSALEHGKRGKPHWSFVQRVITFFNIIWDEAEELQHLALNSDPKVSIDTAGMSASKTRLANLLANEIAVMDAEKVETLTALIEEKNSPQ